MAPATRTDARDSHTEGPPGRGQGIEVLAQLEIGLSELVTLAINEVYGEVVPSP